AAWGSVQYLETQTMFGSFVRGLHHTTSHLMLIGMVMHLLMVVVSAAYRRPKEVTYWSGLILASLVFGLAVTGNPLPWDQKGYQAYQIETSIVGTMPVFGPTMKTLLIGGSEFGSLTLTRLYTLHVVVLPVLATLLLAIHFSLVRREKLMSNCATKRGVDLPIVALPQASSGADSLPYWPFQTSRNLLVFFILMLVATGVTLFGPRLFSNPAGTAAELELPPNEITLQAPADPDLPYLARPEWYVRPLYELRHMVPSDREVLVTGALPLVIVILLSLVPFYDKVVGQMVGRGLASILVLGLIGGSAWLLWYGWKNDHADPAFAKAKSQEQALASRALWLARENGVPPDGPVALLQNDPRVRGPLVFAEHCAGCHTWDGHDGTGKTKRELVDGVDRPVAGTAPDLAGFGGQDWLSAFLKDPTGPKFFGQTDQIKGGERIKNGEMRKWLEENVKPNGPLEDRHVRAVAALVAKESGRGDASGFSEEELKLGQEVFSGDVMNAQGEPLEFAQCLQCHSLKSGDPDGAGSGGLSPAPELDGYGSIAWLQDFVRNPGERKFYGKKNVMPAFDTERLSDRDLDLLLRWMRGEWARPEVQKNAP
ncbi:MAG: cytochrome b N-terminal domain-containing protein, partial [Planctomycetota bacterium]|nr:cytochrome b N-terminal domain-containing protein [Planctomycetota bacterium]